MVTPTLDDEVTFISGVDSTGKVASTSFQAWNGDNPATYDTHTGSGKWGTGTAGTGGGTVSFYFDPASNWTQTEKTIFRDSLTLYSAVANISFVEVSTPPAHGITLTRGADGSAETNYSFSGQAIAGSSTLGSMTGAIVSIDTSVAGFGPLDGNFATAGGYAWSTVVHELGHAMGLGHGGAYNAGSGINPVTHQYSPYDTLESSIMSYVGPRNTNATYYGQYPTNVNWGTSTDASGSWSRVPVTLMPLDILALQRLYGVSQSSLLGGGQTFGFHTNISSSLPFYDFTINTKPVITIYDSGANNALDVSGFAQAAIIDLHAGTYSSVAGLINNVAIAYNTAIDTLYTGDGNDTIAANNDNDFIYSGAGADTIFGGTGNDTINSGDGDDAITPSVGNNVVNGGGGNDTVRYFLNKSNYTISENSGTVYVVGGGESDSLTNIETLIFNDQVMPTSDTLNQIIGTSGDDTLFSTAGDDYIDGGAGVNTLSYANATAGVNANLGMIGPQNTGGAGTDTIVNIQKLIGTNFSDNLWSNPNLSATLSGGGGDDTLLGGSANDILDGGAGTDTAYFNGTIGTRTYNLQNGTASGAGIGTDTLISIEGIIDSSYYGTEIVNGSAGDDTIAVGGPSASAQVSGGDGNDTVSDFGVGSTLYGGGGTNKLSLNRTAITPLNLTFTPGVAGSLADGTTYHDFQIFSLTSGASDDAFTLSHPLVGTNNWNGGGGSDTATVDMSNFTTALSMNAPTTSPNTPSLATINTLTGGAQQIVMTFADVENYRLTGGSGSDRFITGTGNDILEGGGGDDYLDGGAGFDYASYAGATAGVIVNLSIVAAQGTAGAGSDQLVNIEGLIGSNFNDTLTGDSGNNILRGHGGSNLLDGGDGNDTVALSLAPGNYYVTGNGSGSYVIQGPDETDYITNIEQASFDGTGQALTISQILAQSLDPLRYIASNPDLIRSIGYNAGGGLQHYFQHGLAENRSTTSFDALRYLASNPDLIRSIGYDAAQATQHYIQHGYYENRSTTSFDALRYVASNGDLIRSIGYDAAQATQHYIQHGYYENRDPGSFDALRYIASNPDLVRSIGYDPTQATQHYIQHGFFENRSTASFDALRYIASNLDLVRSIGYDAAQGTQHYILHGYYENRSTTSFDALRYVASNPDLIRSIGPDAVQATQHYILHGGYENRDTTSFDALRYIASNTDLIRSIGADATQAAQHYILHGYYENRGLGSFDAVTYMLANSDLHGDQTANTIQYIQQGYYQGRTLSGLFGTEQTNHALTVGASTADTIDTNVDQDWFGVVLNAGQNYTFTLSGADGGGGTLTDPQLKVYDSTNHLLNFDDNSGPGNDALIHMAAPTAGTYYLTVAANAGLTGTYHILAVAG